MLITLLRSPISILSVVTMDEFDIKRKLPASMVPPKTTLYQRYSRGIKSGLVGVSRYDLKLNNMMFKLYSGSLHYFRVPRLNWRNMLRKMRAAGLNTIETCVPWNLHEPQDGIYDFGKGMTDFEQFLDIVEFIEIAKEEDLFIILRPGPYISAEWEFGGLPSWLLRYEGMKIRTSDRRFIGLVERYFKRLLPLVDPLQFQKGGPIIAFQIEHDYGKCQDGENPLDIHYLEKLKEILTSNGIIELLCTCHTPSEGFAGVLEGVLVTANFHNNPLVELELLNQFQPNKPQIVMEYWTAMHDYWGKEHRKWPALTFRDNLRDINAHAGHFNLYMFHGGTNWGFMNGATYEGLATDNEGYQPVVTSYYYDAPLSESGKYTDKYHKVRNLLEDRGIISVQRPRMPVITDHPLPYEPLDIISELAVSDLVKQSTAIESEKLLPMELLDINNNSGQSYGYIVYKKTKIDIPKNSVIKIEGRVCDTVMVLINGVLKSKPLKKVEDLDGFGYWRMKDSTLDLGIDEYKSATLELVVENWGRVSVGKLNQFKQHKGLWQGNVLLNNDILLNWQIIPLEFKRSWLTRLKIWKRPSNSVGPKLYRALLHSDVENVNTFIDMRDWVKGFVVVNGINLGRYSILGPQQMIYLPGAFINKGLNEILIFEHFCVPKPIKFSMNLTYMDPDLMM